MSWKSGAEAEASRSWSLAGMLTAYYAGSAFLIVLLATVFLYWAMLRNVDLEDDRLLADRVRLLQAILQQAPLDMPAVEQEVNEAWQAGQHTQIFIRVIDPRGNMLCESKRMNDHLPSSSFPKPADHPGTGSNVKLATGRAQRVMAVSTPGAQPTDGPWIIQVGMDRSEEEEILADYQENLLYVLVAALGICTFAGYQIARRGIRPVH